jgi:membrane protease YdiL (CAAX protease family)
MPIAGRQLLVFYALTFVLLAVIPLAHALSAGGPMDFDAAGARAAAETGLTWTSNLLVMIRLCIAEPVLWLIVFGSAVPSLAAILVCIGRRAQILALIGRFRLGVPWRVALPEYGLLSLLMVSGLLSVFALRAMLAGPDYEQPSGIMGAGVVGALLAAAFLDQGAVLEELGWRGYALPALQAGPLRPLSAAVLVGVAWGLWHVPRDITVGVVERLGMLQYLLLFVPSFLAGTITTSIIAAYFVNRCGGSVIPAIMVHGPVNDAVGLSGLASLELALSPYHQATKALPFALIALGIIAFAGRRLGLSPGSGVVAGQTAHRDVP